MTLKIKTIQSISLHDWDTFVSATYGRPYCLQQQDGCKGRGVETITVPNAHADDYTADALPRELDGDMGVSFKAWLARDPKEDLTTPRHTGGSYLNLFWERHFYPSLDVLANDLHEKGLLPAGTYQIVIDW